jgi:DNA repair protein RadD
VLRDYQIEAANRVRAAWSMGARNVLLVMPTGAGKTVTKASIMKTLNVPAVAIAHRQELVLQISCSLAATGIVHNLIAPNTIVKFCVHQHVAKFGRSFYNRNAHTAVASVRTLLTRADKIRQFLNRVQLWDIDEAHHVLPTNQWGQAVDLFPNAIGLGVTATPERCDKQPLNGVFNYMVVGPTARELINLGHLSDYRIFCPPQSLNMDRVRISSSSGEYVKKDLVAETERSQIVGDVVGHYLRIAPGKRGLTFAVDVASANAIADAYNAAGVPAAVVTAKTPDNIRTNLLDRLADGRMKQLVNVDLFGEGMDCPALEVVSMARPTQSYGLYVQQFGRALRPFPGKERAIIIDHVGNVVRHGLPDAPRNWSLSAPEVRRRTSDAMPLTVCLSCLQPYRRTLSACPYCSYKPEPESRRHPEYVDGDLVEIDEDVLAKMRGEVDRIHGPLRVPRNMEGPAVLATQRRWRERQEAQRNLVEAMALWSGQWHHGHGESDSEIQRRFFLTFGVDVLTAQTLGTPDAMKLQQRIEECLK